MPYESRTTLSRGKPVSLEGSVLAVGEDAPDFKVLDAAGKPVSLDAFKGKKTVLFSVPSLDTPVCDLETRRFNAEAVKLSPDVEVAAVSMDLPYAIKRWCGAAGVERVRGLSDHREASFGKAYGVLIPSIRLLARAVFIVDSTAKMRYIQLVEDMGKEPDYAEVLAALKGVD